MSRDARNMAPQRRCSRSSMDRAKRGPAAVGKNAATNVLRSRHERVTEATVVLPLQQLADDLQRGRAGIAAPGEEGEQPPFADDRRKVAELARPPRGHRPRLDLG